MIGRKTEGGGSRYYMKGHLGSVRVVMDDSANVEETRDYYPFGLPMPGRYEKGSPPTKEDFTGYEKDESTQLHYAGARYYSAAFGRFTTTDRFADKYPSLSPYQYAANSPVNIIDVNGDSLQVSGTKQQVIALLAGLSNSCGCKVNTSFNEGESGVTAKVTGFEGEDDDFYKQQEVLQTVVSDDKMFTMKTVNTDDSKIDEIERRGGIMFSVDSKEILVADHWLDGEWNNSNRPSYQYTDNSRPASSMDWLAWQMTRWFTDTYAYKGRRSVPLGEGIGHEMVHVADYATGQLLNMTRRQAENRAISIMNTMRRNKGIPVREGY